MAEIVQTMKLHIHPDKQAVAAFKELTVRYSDACNYISQYVFDHHCHSYTKLNKVLYVSIRDTYDLKSQLSQSAIKTVVARYKTVKDQLFKHPYKYQDKEDKTKYITRTLEWLTKPVFFKRPQADLVRNRDYSFVDDGKYLSINTLDKRVKVSFDVPKCFKEYFNGDWSFGTAKLVSLKGEWYLHIPMTKVIPDTFDVTKPAHVVGIDRGLRFLATTYDEKGKCNFISGKDVIAKRNAFLKVRSELQAKGTKSAKRKLKAISGRENRYMTDVNHQISKTLVKRYGENTLYVLEDLTDVSFDEGNLSSRDKRGRNEVRSWAFYQLEEFLTYKAHATNSEVVKVEAAYTSQRCPKCGRIHKENRHHETHEYVCDSCGYRSNDDRIGAMNIYRLGTMYKPDGEPPKFKDNKQIK